MNTPEAVVFVAVDLGTPELLAEISEYVHDQVRRILWPFNATNPDTGHQIWSAGRILMESDDEGFPSRRPEVFTLDYIAGVMLYHGIGEQPGSDGERLPGWRVSIQQVGLGWMERAPGADKPHFEWLADSDGFRVSEATVGLSWVLFEVLA